jgi:hypothetical protein
MSESNGVKPKGRLATPEEVVKLVDGFAGLAPTAEERRRELNNFTLSYYYGGEIVVCRMDDDGVEVMASGDEVGPYLRITPWEERKRTIVVCPTPLGAIVE